MSNLREKDGNPAFPVIAHNEVYATGMSLRDWYAGMALQGMLAYSHVNPSCGNFVENCTQEDRAKYAYAMADEMLKARKS